MRETLLAVEVGSTYTKLVAFHERAGRLRLAGRVATRTTLADGDVRIGVARLLDAARDFGATAGQPAYLTSSAAGGLRVAVCGLTPSLSTKVGVETALGAGGVVVFAVAGRLTPRDVAELVAARPGLVLVCGGTDHGEAAAVLANVATLADVALDAVFLFAGNARIRAEVTELLSQAGKPCFLTDNVYPESDCFRFEEVRDAIRLTYERTVMKAPGIDELQQSFGLGCLPTPLAVSRSVEVMGESLGGLLVFDVGGATTDVHSYVGTPQPDDVVSAGFEPRLKRTVEGDLGVFHNLASLLSEDELAEVDPAAPVVDGDRLGTYALRAVRRGLARHCGRVERAYGPGGGRDVVHGADLRRVTTVLATGGALRHGLPDPTVLREPLAELAGSRLVPERVGAWLIDRQYLMSSLGSMLGERADAVRAFIDEGFAEGVW